MIGKRDRVRGFFRRWMSRMMGARLISTAQHGARPVLVGSRRSGLALARCLRLRTGERKRAAEPPSKVIGGRMLDRAKPAYATYRKGEIPSLSERRRY